MSVSSSHQMGESPAGPHDWIAPLVRGSAPLHIHVRITCSYTRRLPPQAPGLPQVRRHCAPEALSLTTVKLSEHSKVLLFVFCHVSFPSSFISVPLTRITHLS